MAMQRPDRAIGTPRPRTQVRGRPRLSASEEMTFDFTPIPKLFFGAGQIARLAELIPPTSRILLVYNGSDVLAERIATLLPDKPTIIRQKGEPTVESIDRAVAQGR